MKVVSFQLQKKGSINIYDFLKRIDINAPIPQPLEGGDFKGPLYQCILDSKYTDTLLQTCSTSKDMKVYTECMEYEIESSLYKPTHFVQWQVDKEPTISEMK